MDKIICNICNKKIAKSYMTKHKQKKLMSVIYAMNYFLKILNVKDVNLYVALHVSIGFILRIIIIVQYAAIKLFNI